MLRHVRGERYTILNRPNKSLPKGEFRFLRRCHRSQQRQLYIDVLRMYVTMYNYLLPRVVKLPQLIRKGGRSFLIVFSI